MTRLLDRDTGGVVFARLEIADAFWRRAIGLLGRIRLDPDEAILIRPCRSVHTCAMRMEIAVAFCDQDARVVRVIETLQPWRFRFGPSGTQFVIEFAPGSTVLKEGQRLKIDGC